MRKFNLFVIAALMGSMTFTACTLEDNAVAPSAPSGELSDDIDMFKTVKANEGDPAVVAAHKQPIDHDNPALGTYEQQVVLTYVSPDAPTILHTQGYALAGEHGQNHNRLDSIDAPMFMYMLATGQNADGSFKFSTNCVQVEYRYHGFSLPEGDENSFKYLSAKQQSADLHNIVTDLKKALLKGKWLSTGVSKNGMTTYDYAYYYPGDVDVYVPFVAPLLFQDEDMRIGDYMITGSVKDYLPQIKAAFQKLVSDQKVLFIPKEGDDPATYALFFYLNENDLRIYKSVSEARGPLRKRDNPFAMQVSVDQGNIGYNYSWVKEGTLLTDSDKKYFDDKEKSNKASKKTELSYLVKDFLKTTDCKMFFVYGENDPWTGAAIDDPTNENVKKLIIKNGTHNDAIPTYTADERNQLMDFVKSILFPASATK